ncbi:MAG: amino acid ABC transporter permease [candidate division WOR-3 bacterium]|nr:amino acid ABC transporter permease [candidate division WOR-3 bacterium]
MAFFWNTLLPDLTGGFLVTLKILAFAIPISVIFAILVASARVYGGKVISFIAASYVVIFRGLPLIVTLLIIYFGLTRFAIYLSSFWAAVTGFIICSSAYQSEYIRGAMRSIEKGQSQAARSQGMKRLQELRYIVLPQAYRRALPGISNEIIYLIKYSSLGFVIGVPEIFAISKSLNSLYLSPLLIFGTAGVYYLAATTLADRFFTWWESRLEVPGLEISGR